MADKASQKINLTHDVQVNGVKIPKGTHEVPAEQADDLMRIDREYSEHLDSRHIRHDYQRSAGSIAVGGNE
jgi:hypothetical protein